MIRLISAIDSTGGIARNGQMPWNLPGDLQYFRQMTTQHGANVLMGRTTFESIGKLNGRQNYIVSHQTIKNEENIFHVADLPKFLKEFEQDIWVIGGQEIYSETIKKADELYLTKIDNDFGCDKFFPDYKTDFQLVESKGPFMENGLSYHFQRFIPKS